MVWQGIRGHDRVIEQFRQGLTKGRLASTFLFVGPEGIGKRQVATKLAQAMLCTTHEETELDPCGTCPACQQVLSDSHPDLQIVQKPADRAFIPVETFIGDRENRMRTGLCRFISLTAGQDKRRIAIVDDADWLNQEGANSLLKTLEEPSPGAVIILISTSAQRQLPTIRSRSQIVRFHPLSLPDVVACLLDGGHAESTTQAEEMASRADGSVARAIALADPDTIAFRSNLWSALAQPRIDRAGLSKAVNAYADSGGKETAAKRGQLRLAFQAAAEFYRAVARGGAGADLPEHVELKQAVTLALSRDSGVAEVALSQVDRCLDAIREVNSNANLGILVDAWVCDLAVMTRTQQGILSA